MFMVHRPWRTNMGSRLLVLAAIAFTLTASAYAVMAVKRLETAPSAGAESSPGLLDFLDRYGAGLMAAELVVLAAAAAAAIGIERRQAARRGVPAGAEGEEEQVQRE
jgi:hypothetical protein